MPGPKPGALPLGHIPSLIHVTKLSLLHCTLITTITARCDTFIYMAKNRRKPIVRTANFEKIISGGQSLGAITSEENANDIGKKIMAWGVLPGETANILLTKNKSSYCEGIVHDPINENLLLTNENQRIEPKDPESYLSTSPWQIMNFSAEQFYKSALVEEAFEMQNIVLPFPIETWSNNKEFYYRNKIEYSFWYSNDTEKLDLAFFKRGSHNKIAISETSLAMPEITGLSKKILKVLNENKIGGRDLKTLLIRANQQGETAWQLYVKEKNILTNTLKNGLNEFNNGEIIFSNPKSPASVVTEKLFKTNDFKELSDKIFEKTFSYKTEGFFQINLPAYEKVLEDIKPFIEPNLPVLDLYSGVGTIGLSVASMNSLTLVEINPVAVDEMKSNIKKLKLERTAKAILTPSENATEFIEQDQIVILDPPRAGVHKLVIDKLLEEQPKTIIYLSCNPVTQARDIAPLLTNYSIEYHKGYNFFPRTPHIEHLVILRHL